MDYEEIFHLQKYTMLSCRAIWNNKYMLVFIAVIEPKKLLHHYILTNVSRKGKRKKQQLYTLNLAKTSEVFEKLE